MSSCAAAVVDVMRHPTCSSTGKRPPGRTSGERSEKGRGSASPLWCGEAVPVDRAPSEPWRRTGLQTTELEPQDAAVPRRSGWPLLRRSGPPSTRLFAGVHQPPHERAGGEDDGAGSNHAADAPLAPRPRRETDRPARRVRRSRRCARSPHRWRQPVPDPAASTTPTTRPSFDQQVVDASRDHLDGAAGRDQTLDLRRVGVLVGLGPRTAHGGALRRVQHLEHDAGGVDGSAHDAAEGVDLAHDLPLREAADRGVTAHLADAGGIHGDQRDAAHPPPREHRRGGPRRFRSGMTAADHDDLVLLVHRHSITPRRNSRHGPSSSRQ